MLKKYFILGLLFFTLGILPSAQSTSANATTQSAGCTYPAQIFDFINWKETLPVGSLGNPTEIKQPALATYSYDPYFVVNSGCDGVQFRAPVNGVTTSGSSYSRSELREMTNNGTTNASWATDSGVHTMFIDEAITAVPITKRHIVVGQVHNSSDDVIVIRLEYPKLFVDINGTTGPTLDANYTLGKRFTVKFVASNGQINIYYNGSENPVYTLNKIGSGNYFKAGAYTQSNCSKELSGNCVSANYGEVIIYNVWIAHSSPPSLSLPLNSLANNNTLIAHSNNFSDGYDPSKLWDGCYEGTLYDSTTCTTGGRNISSFWLEFDLGKLYTISQARLYGDAEGTWVSKSWKMSYKKNVTDNWKTVFSSENALFNKWSTRSLNIIARHIRIEVLGNKKYSPGRTQARELEIYGIETKNIQAQSDSKEILGSVLESVSDFTEGWLKNNLFILSLIILLILLVIYIIWALWLRKK
ncbi:MAG: SCE65.33c, polyguluronate lyase [Candidatus Peregrinibacteria bacterium GW2011_GWF2_33_10]|uniref:Alginate lyase n=3 Tax=Candidatus Nomuraibacteriota TaxID=1752729 RepID=A0A0G0H3D4_9BACT|nr:MAG: SCE65.33c, polyguluronate lyase [Candidatus Peregrinibacteria bacterium GW2011_GWF2_33_10]KKP72304.1 MAG: Alginate lyase [Candidatus Nomurabacteria bacterium GW2011_GWB1_35_20]KKP75596.1 MAG: Alginate lyase [Parcubacteria group bacterium GW2011_GWC1_35_21]KKP78341.1 MAG: Alginate lyase [Candidatus Nomurabacteria bacterium GW2011_GWC2_35_35]KKP88671.1 MAG: Alginate lyase [Candidatus Nomurabacteria bacterium GW2011_GWA2_35_80]KKP98437.1 MAG: Alginate lyase [Candidatus Nomurabacteria bact